MEQPSQLVLKQHNANAHRYMQYSEVKQKPAKSFLFLKLGATEKYETWIYNLKGVEPQILKLCVENCETLYIEYI